MALGGRPTWEGYLSIRVDPSTRSHGWAAGDREEVGGWSPRRRAGKMAANQDGGGRKCGGASCVSGGGGAR